MVQSGQQSLMVSLEGMLKLRITVAVVLTCLVGYVLAKGAINQEVLLPTLGLALMSFAEIGRAHV